MTLKKKILTIGLIPLIFFILLGAKNSFESFQVYENSQNISESMKFAQITTKLIHETQKERGASVGFLKGGILVEKVKEQRAVVDSFHKEALLEVSHIKFSEEYKKKLIEVLNKYKGIREGVSVKELSSGESIKKYTQIITMLIDYNASVAKLSIFGETSASLRTLQTIEYVKEFSGKLRATMTGFLGMNVPLGLKELRKMQNLMLGVVLSIDSKALIFSNEGNELKFSFLNSKEWLKTLEVYETIISKKDEGNYGVKAEEFFSIISIAIDKLNALIQFQQDEVLKIVNKKQDKSYRELLTITLSVITLSLFMIFFILKFTSNLTLQLNHVSREMVASIAKISLLSNNISRHSGDLSVSSEEQSASMQETSATMDEIDSMIKRNTLDAKSSSDVSMDSYNDIKDSVERMKKLGTALESINCSNDKVTAQITNSNDKMNEIGIIIKGIGEKTQVINDIVFQTKLLSFNASVEAARAGEHGKGFAVVAEEVGKLAQMSGRASKEIYKMLEDSIATVEKVACEQKNVMEELIAESHKSIEYGMKIEKESEDFLKSVLLNMDGLNQSVSQISLASDEQSKGVDEISKAIKEVNDTTRINSVIASETSTISSELDGSIESFRNLVVTLKNIVSKDEKNKNLMKETILQEEVSNVESLDNTKFKDIA